MKSNVESINNSDSTMITLDAIPRKTNSDCEENYKRGWGSNNSLNLCNK